MRISALMQMQQGGRPKSVRDCRPPLPRVIGGLLGVSPLSPDGGIAYMECQSLDVRDQHSDNAMRGEGDD